MTVIDFGSGAGPQKKPNESGLTGADIERINDPDTSAKMSTEQVAAGFRRALEQEMRGARTRVEALKQNERVTLINRVLEDFNKEVERILSSDAPDKTKAGQVYSHFEKSKQNIQGAEAGQDIEPAIREQTTPIKPEASQPMETVEPEPGIDMQPKNTPEKPDPLDKIVADFGRTDGLDKAAAPEKIARLFLQELGKKAGEIIDELKAENRAEAIQRKVAKLASQTQEHIISILDSSISAQEKLDKFQEIKLNASVEMSKLKLDADFGEDNQDIEADTDKDKVEGPQEAEPILTDNAGPEVPSTSPELSTTQTVPEQTSAPEDGVKASEETPDQVPAQPKGGRKAKAFMQGATAGAAALAAGVILGNTAPVQMAVQATKDKIENIFKKDTETGEVSPEAEKAMDQETFFRIFNDIADEKATKEQLAMIDSLRKGDPDTYMEYMTH